MAMARPRLTASRVKSIEDSLADAEEPGTRLRRALGPLDLTVFGVSVVLGAGILTTTARVAGDVSGPAVSVAFLIAAVACGLAAFCYAEFASTVPVAGSAFTYAYATFGEIAAWIIGWDLLLEYALGAATVAKSWSRYLGESVGAAGLTSMEVGSVTFDWGAVMLVGTLTTVLVLGIKLSSRVSVVLTSVKIVLILFVIVVGASFVQEANYDPFLPPAQPTPRTGSALDSSLLSFMFGGAGSSYGLFGLLAGASLVFFAYIGFDAVSTTAEETRDPQRDLPRGILGSLLLTTALYILVSLVLTGMVKYTKLKTPPNTNETATIATAFRLVGADWAAAIVSVGAVAGLTTVVLVLMLGQSRVLFAMSRDGLLPRALARVGSHDTPSRITIVIGVGSGALAGLTPTKALEEMVNIGTLFAFILVACGAWRLRRTRPDLERRFKEPALPACALFTVLSCSWLMANLAVATWLRFLGWLVLGAGVYFFYSRRHSTMALRTRRGVVPSSSNAKHRPNRTLSRDKLRVPVRLITRRIRPYTPASDLPPTRRALWLIVLLFSLTALGTWMTLVRDSPEVLVGTPTADVPTTSIRLALGVGVPTTLVIVAVLALWRFQLERLAARPGPVRVKAFRDLSEQAPTREISTTASASRGEQASSLETPLAAELAAWVQHYLMRTKLYGSTAIPPTGSYSDFLHVIEAAGATAQGVWGAISRLPRLFWPTHSYELECTVLPAGQLSGRFRNPGSRDGDDLECVLLVELTRLPSYRVKPIIIRDRDWDRATERTAHWVAGVVLPRTRRCRESPWTMWRSLRLPDDLFDASQRFQQQRQDLQFDEAMASLRRATTLDPTNLALRLESGKLQEQLGMYLDALATYDDIIERASRTKRELAFMWHLPPYPPAPHDARVEIDDYVDVAWHDEARIPELHADHPVIYVARYRHMLLLGHGDRIADQWWRDPEEHCFGWHHVPAQERRRDYARRTLSKRFEARYRWIGDALIERHVLDSSMSEHLDPAVRRPGGANSAQTSEGVTSRTSKIMDAYMFFCLTSVASWELLNKERATDVQTPRAIRRVVPLRSLKLVAPWVVLRAGLALRSAQVVDRREADLENAEQSLLFPRSSPWVLGRPGLFKGSWPPDLGFLTRHIDSIMGSRFHTLFSWHEHYNAACVFALSLLEAPRSAPDVSQQRAFFPAQAPPAGKPDPKAVQAAIDELTKAVACGNSGFLAAQREWLLTEDPDLDVLRGTVDFRNLEAATFGSVRRAVQRGPRLVVWQLRTFVSSFVVHVAREAAKKLAATLNDVSGVGEALEQLLDADRELWTLVEAVIRDHRDSQTRYEMIQRYSLVARRFALEPPDLAHPRFSKRRLALQLASQSGSATIFAVDDDPESISNAIGAFTDRATMRLFRSATLLRDETDVDSCCSLAKDLLPVRELRDGSEALRVGDRDAFQFVSTLLASDLLRWTALADHFDDSYLWASSLEDREEVFESTMRTGAESAGGGPEGAETLPSSASDVAPTVSETLDE